MLPLTIAIPVLNAEATIGATLESLRALREFSEIFVVDSNSSDATVEIARQHNYDVLQVPAGNLYAAVNTGLNAGSAQWVTYINADDLVYAESIRKRIERVDNDSDVLYGPVDFIDCEGRFLRSWRPAREEALWPLYQAGFSPMLQQGTLIRRDLFEKLDGFSTQYRYVADADFWFRAIEAGAHFRYDGPATVAAFRLHGAQITLQKKTEMEAEHRAMVRDHGGPQLSVLTRAEFWRWRWRNAGSYLERWHRAHRIGAERVFCGSYDLTS